MEINSAEILIRTVNLEDIQFLQKLFIETIESSCKNDYTPEQIKAWTSTAENIDRWNSMVEKQFSLIAQLNNKILGFASLQNDNYVDFLYVHKDFLRNGIANVLYDNLKKESTEKGCQKMSSDVSKTARPFFESKGFKVVRENKKLIKGVEIVNYYMIQ
ncbi:MAG: GNAT family N-acetyltransferase [Cytophagales bacterium]